MAQSGLCTAFPQVLQRRQLRERGGCQDGVQEPAAAPPGAQGLHPLAQARQRPWVSPGLGTALAPKRGDLCHPLLPCWLWLCPTPPSLGWGYSGPLLLLSSFSPAASRNALFVRPQLRWGQAGPVPSTRAVPRCPCLSRRGVSSAPGALAPLLPRPHKERPHLLLARGAGACPARGNHPVMYNNKKQVRAAFWGRMWPEVVVVEGTQGGFGEQSRALGLRFVAVVWDEGCKSSCSPTLFYLHSCIPHSVLSCVTPPSPRCPDPQGLSNAPSKPC